MKHFLFYFILTVLSSILSCFDLNSKQKLYQTINDLTSENREAPVNYEKYITDLKTTTYFYFGKYQTEAQLLELQKTYGFGDSSLNLCKTTLANKAKDKIELLKEQQIKAKNSMDEFIGALIYDSDGNVYYVIIKASTTGQVLKQIEIKTREVCKKKRFHRRHCWNENYEEERENNQDEINGMKQVILSKSLLGIKTKFYEENEKLHKEIQNVQQPGGSSGSTITKDPVQEAIQAKKNTFITNLQKLVDNSRTKPAGYDVLVRNIHSLTDVNMDMFNKNEVDAIAKKYTLPEEVTQKLKTIAFLSQDSITDTVKYINNNKKATIEELLGVIIKEKDTVFFAFIRCFTEGEIPYRTKNVSVKICHSTLLGHSCHHENQIVEDPYTAEEMEKVKQALMAISSENFRAKLNTISESQTLLGSGKIVSPDGKIAAILNKDGKVYVGPSENPLSGTLYTIGTDQPETFAPYSLQVKENGNLYIINKNNDKVWTSNTANKGQEPFKLSLDNDGVLSLIDKDNKVIFQGK